MTIFLTSKELRERNESLEKVNSDLRADITARDEEIATLKNEVATAKEELSAVNAANAELTGDLDAAKQVIEANAEKVEAAEKQEATFADRVEQSALAKFQSLGGEPVPASNKDAAGSNTISRSEFAALSPAAKSEHAKSGGKLKD